jgi:hypothetical protein
MAKLLHKANIALILLIPIFLLTNCGYYSSSGSGLKGVKSVAVPLFEDQTQEYGLRESLTQKVVDSYVQDNTLKVVNQKNSDSILYGIITAYLREAHTFDENENIKEYRVRIFVKATLEETQKKKIIWEEDNLEGWAIYSAVDETEDDGKEKALEKLAEDIVNRTVKGW